MLVIMEKISFQSRSKLNGNSIKNWSQEKSVNLYSFICRYVYSYLNCSYIGPFLTANFKLSVLVRGLKYPLTMSMLC